MSVPGQKHFYCHQNFLGEWLVCELRCKKKNIDGSFCIHCKSKWYAYCLRSVLNNIYKLDYTFLFFIRSLCVLDLDYFIIYSHSLCIFNYLENKNV